MRKAPLGWHAIKQMSKELKCNAPSLLVLSRQNDPFYCGQPAQCQQAQWFAALWKEFRFPVGVHLRRMHYQLISTKEPVKKPDSGNYVNSHECWTLLSEAAKYARHLNLVDPAAFEDARNPPPHLFARYGQVQPEPQWNLTDFPDWQLPTIPTNLAQGLAFGLPQPWVDGYDYDLRDQPFHLEIWIEKSTQNDVLEPLCRQLGMNLVTSVGFQSVTGSIKLLQRLQLIQRLIPEGKRARVFYISDFDPAGDHMPVAVARMLEYYRERYAPGVEIKLQPIVLTREQVEHYQLPQVPIKESDLRKAGWEARHGRGATELDALEALHPGELSRIILAAAQPYRDDALPEALREAEREAQEQVDEAWDRAIRRERQELDDLEQQARRIVAGYQAELEQLNNRLQQELAPIKERLPSVRHAIQIRCEGLLAEIPERPEAVLDTPAEDDWLFDSTRDYHAQLAAYKTHKRVHD